MTDPNSIAEQDRGEFICVTHPNRLRCCLELEENFVATDQAAIETWRAFVEKNLPLWKRWFERIRNCEAQFDILFAKFQNMPPEPENLTDWSRKLARKMELNEAREVVGQRYKECSRAIDSAMSLMAVWVSPAPDALTRCYEAYEISRMHYQRLLEAFRLECLDPISGTS